MVSAGRDHEDTYRRGQPHPGDRKVVRANGGKLVANINFPLGTRWAVSAGADARGWVSAQAKRCWMMGRFAPAGKLPLTLYEVLRVDAGRSSQPQRCARLCRKDAYMPDALKDENRKAYGYSGDEQAATMSWALACAMSCKGIGCICGADICRNKSC